MAKNRQIETDLFSQGWFYELSNDAKILYIYCYLNADNAGIIELINRRIQFDLQIDIEKSFIEIKNEFTVIGNNRFLMKRILFTQFPNGLCSPEHPFQKSVIKLLENEGIDTETYELLQALPEAYPSLTQALPKAHSNSISNSLSLSNSSSNSPKKKIEKKSNYESWIDSGADGKKEVRPYVWLDESELEKLTAKYEDSEKLNLAIDEVSDSKGSKNMKRPTKFNYELHYKNSYQVLNSGWAWEKHLKRVELENRVKSSENFLQVSESRLNGNNPQNKTPETSFNPKIEQSTYDKKIMQPKPSFLVSESGRKIYLNWDSLISLDGWPDCKFPAVSGETKLKHLPEIDKQAYCSFFQIEIESLKPRN